MSALLADERIVWFVMRGTGVVVEALLTLAVVLGVLSTARAGSRWWPQFATQAVHRTVSLLAVALLVAHVTSAVVHTFVDVRWWQAFVPFVGAYEPFWMGLGAVSLDLLAVVTVTSLLRRRLGHTRAGTTRMSERTWRGVHLTSYSAWAIGVAHGLGIGTDATTLWAGSVTAVSVLLVVGAVVLRLVTLRGEAPHGHGPHPTASAPSVSLHSESGR